MSFSLISSPLQGFTDFRFRNAFNKFFGGIDAFYAPYIRLDGKNEIKSAYERDILPENNTKIVVIPQIMTKDALEFITVIQYVQKRGYNEINWNLGCPYPMVTKRSLGSGLIGKPFLVDSILNKVFETTNIKISVKMRLGYESKDEILNLMPLLNNYPLKNISIHPRIGKQLYKGSVDLDTFQLCIDNTNHVLCYNGDINSVDSFNQLSNRFPSVNQWLIGRGLIANPFLPVMIKNNTSNYPENRFEIFKNFHDYLYNENLRALSGPGHLLMKMQHYWEYFSHLFSDPHKTFKKIRKARDLFAYQHAVRDMLNF
ncbi:MAG: tRNA-dihydrouridine synthase family protein [Bacteroidales bacterium]|nr:tRNA-dihydrouridine synthase family protein [Bacteroidales bacterium]